MDFTSFSQNAEWRSEMKSRGSPRTNRIVSWTEVPESHLSVDDFGHF